MAKHMLAGLVLAIISSVSQADLMRDPTAPFKPPAAVAGQAKAEVSYHVVAIVYRKSRPTAIVNGVHVGIGSQVKGASVQRIEPHRVLLKTAEGSRWIALSKEASMKKINQ